MPAWLAVPSSRQCHPLSIGYATSQRQHQAELGFEKPLLPGEGPPSLLLPFPLANRKNFLAQEYTGLCSFTTTKGYKGEDPHPFTLVRLQDPKLFKREIC